MFLSYTTAASNGAWVREHFFTVFQERLDNAMPRTPKVFMFEEQESPRIAWPESLEQALRTSRVLLAVVSPPYFRSRWCLAEWTSVSNARRQPGSARQINPVCSFTRWCTPTACASPPEAQRNFKP